MAWVESRKASDGTKRWRLREELPGGEKRTVIRDLGMWKPQAYDARRNYEKAIAMGFVCQPPIDVQTITAFLEAKAKGLDAPNQGRRLLIEEMCDLYLKHFGPSLQGGANEHYRSAYNGLRLRLDLLKMLWSGRYADEITMFDVRDLLTRWDPAGTKLRYLGAFGAMFKAFAEWNEEGESILPYKVQLPVKNPFSRWRRKMKPGEKKEEPDTRVLTHEEWARFASCLRSRTRAICELALRRFLRKSDIMRITGYSIHGNRIKGTQQKTQHSYSVPALANQPIHYDFTNFRRDFEDAQKKAGLFFPPEDPRHFSLKDLRRTGATWAYEKTKDIVAISRMLGHQDISTTKRYLNIREEDIDRVAAVVDELSAVVPKGPRVV